MIESNILLAIGTIVLGGGVAIAGWALRSVVSMGKTLERIVERLDGHEEICSNDKKRIDSRIDEASRRIYSVEQALIFKGEQIQVKLDKVINMLESRRD